MKFIRRFLPCFFIPSMAMLAQEGTTLWTSYLKSNIECIEFKEPDSCWYRKKLAQNEIEDTKKRVWKAWEEANKERLATFAKIMGNSSRDSLLWHLPQESKMLFAIIKEGERLPSGYPLYINLHGGGGYPELESAWESETNSSEWASAKLLGQYLYKDGPSSYCVPRMPDDRKGH